MGDIEKIAFVFSYPVTIGVIFFILIWVLLRKSKRMHNFSLMFLSGFFAWFVSQAIKEILRIPRPSNTVGAIVETTFSFPSAHTAVFFALATAMLLINRRFAFFLFIMASLIAISRVVLNVHYSIDIIGGALIGVFIGAFISSIFKKL